MPARARPAATIVATIQPVDFVVGAVGVVVGVDMIVIFLSLWFGLWCSVDHNFPAVITLPGSAEWWAYRLNAASTD